MKNAQERLKVMREVALRADNMQETAREIGGNAALGLTRSRRAQVTGLESIANSALKTTDVLDYIKLRTARQRRDEWTYGNWGPVLLDYLSKTLASERDVICKQLGIDVPSIDSVEVHLMLVREFVRQFSAEYEYQCRLNEVRGQQSAQPYQAQRGGR
jgi:hypothetical protein